MRRATLTLAFLCILALAYLAWAQQQDIVMLAQEVGTLDAKLQDIAKPKPRKPAAKKETS